MIKPSIKSGFLVVGAGLVLGQRWSGYGPRVANGGPLMAWQWSSDGPKVAWGWPNHGLGVARLWLLGGPEVIQW
jgi:hypothetical protein